MDSVEHYRRLFAFDEWANREILMLLQANGGNPARSLELLSHMFAAERLWLERITRVPQSVAVWPQLRIDQCGHEAENLPKLWRSFLSQKTEESLGEMVLYKNTKGEPFSSRIDDILMHVIMHAVYHRGQITADMRASGTTPAYTDFIHGVRQGFVK